MNKVTNVNYTNAVMNLANSTKIEVLTTKNISFLYPSSSFQKDAMLLHYTSLPMSYPLPNTYPCQLVKIPQLMSIREKQGMSSDPINERPLARNNRMQGKKVQTSN